MPFAGYRDFDQCVRRNRGKDDPEAYCATVMRAVEKGAVPFAKYRADQRRDDHGRFADEGGGAIPTIARGLVIQPPGDKTGWPKATRARLLAGTATLDDVLMYVDRKDVGAYWYSSLGESVGFAAERKMSGADYAIEGAREFVEGEPEVNEESMWQWRDDPDFHGTLGVVLIAEGPPGWSEAENPSGGLMGNSYINRGRVDLQLTEVRYNAGRGWHALKVPRTKKYRVTVAKSAIQKFNPAQPRVPAGEPTGGQWTSGSIPTSGPMAPTVRSGAMRLAPGHPGASARGSGGWTERPAAASKAAWDRYKDDPSRVRRYEGRKYDDDLIREWAAEPHEIYGMIGEDGRVLAAVTDDDEYSTSLDALSGGSWTTGGVDVHNHPNPSGLSDADVFSFADLRTRASTVLVRLPGRIGLHTIRTKGEPSAETEQQAKAASQELALFRLFAMRDLRTPGRADTNFGRAVTRAQRHVEGLRLNPNSQRHRAELFHRTSVEYLAEILKDKPLLTVEYREMGRTKLTLKKAAGIEITVKPGTVLDEREWFKPIAKRDRLDFMARLLAKFDESKHPRHPAGSSQGGEFAPGDGGDEDARQVSEIETKFDMHGIMDVTEFPDDFSVGFLTPSGKLYDIGDLSHLHAGQKISVSTIELRRLGFMRMYSGERVSIEISQPMAPASYQRFLRFIRERGNPEVVIDGPIGFKELPMGVPAIDLREGLRIVGAAPVAKFDESKHPRHPAGSSQGGEFAPGGGTGVAESDERTMAPTLRAVVETEVILMGYDPTRVTIKPERGGPFTVAGHSFERAGEYDPRTDQVTLFANAFGHGDEATQAITVHEVMHAKHRTAELTMRALQDGSVTGSAAGWYRDYPEVGAWEEILGPDGGNMGTTVTNLRGEDGVSPYSRVYWEAFEQSLARRAAGGRDDSVLTLHSAINETLAEMAVERRRSGVLPGGKRFRRLFHATEKIYQRMRGTGAQGYPLRLSPGIERLMRPEDPRDPPTWEYVWREYGGR